MKQSRRLQEIFRKNREFEKESPYNFCDRWCERCTRQKQLRCTLYKDELERRMTCIAHGKDEDDLEITKQVLEAQCKEVEDKLNEDADKFGLDLDYPGIDQLDNESLIDFSDLPENIQRHIGFVENNPLDKVAKNYCRKTHTFLKETFYKNENANPKLKDDFETVAWYHTLLPAKLHRALCGFHEPATEGDISLYDAVAQLEICRKAAKASILALQKIKSAYSRFRFRVSELVALLHNIHSRIELMEEEI